MSITQWEIRRTAVGQANIQLLLCDDDPIFLDTLRTALEHVFQKLNIKTTTAAVLTPRELTAEQLSTCDIAFLDIDFENEDKNGKNAVDELCGLWYNGTIKIMGKRYSL